MTFHWLGILILSIGVLFLSGPADATVLTVGPTDCSATAVNNAISSASDGDTVQLTCAGSVTWFETVSIPTTKGVTLSVSGGTNTPKGSPNFPLTVISSQTPAVRITVGPNNSLSRISGFKFQTPSGATIGDGGLIQATGQGLGKTGVGSFRVDNNYLDNVSANAVITVFESNPGGGLYGVLDNNTMHNAYSGNDIDNGPYGIQVWNRWHNEDDCWGADGWVDEQHPSANPFHFGDQNFVFIEDNLFENDNTSANSYVRHYVSAELGGRYVVRYNTFKVTVDSPAHNQTDMIDAHGFCLCASNGKGSRGGEIYQNTITGIDSMIGRPMLIRGGTWLIFGNTFDAIGSYGAPPYFMEYRAGDSDLYSQCSATCPCTASWVPICSDASHYPLPEQISGTYIWNNMYQGVNQTGTVDSAGVQSLYIQPGRDYFVSPNKPAALSSYVPYTYPHPLRGEAERGKRPSPPSDVRVQ